MIAPDVLPRTQVFDYFEPEDGECMEFRLTYKGPLKAQGSSGGRTEDKHKIRKNIHKQLRALWNTHPNLRALSQNRYIVSTIEPGSMMPPPSMFPNKLIHQVSTDDFMDSPNVKTWPEHIADEYPMFNTRFVPLVRKATGLTCSLEILFLRRDGPGSLIHSGGDIDNRIKVLFDGLRMPGCVSDLGGIPIDADENPFFCLLEDDSLVTSVSVTTDRLLTPQETDEHINSVDLCIHVTVVNPSSIFAGNRFV